MKPIALSLASNQFIPTEPKAGTSDAPVFNTLAAVQPALALSRDQLTLQEVGRISAAIFDQAAKARADAVAKADALVADLPGFEPFEQVSIIPTEALYVESELGDCALCEPFVIAQHELELERMALENRKLRREIELLEQYKDYRCCDDAHEDDDSDD